MTSTTSLSSKGWVQPILLAGFVCLMFFSGLGGYDLSAPDEPHYALVAKEMLSDNHWLQPHRNETPYPDKPPLLFWSIAAFSALNGGEVSALTARLPSALAAVLVLLTMWSFARRKEENDQLALFVVLTLTCSFRFFFQARMAQIDMLLTACTTAACWLGFQLVSDAYPTQDRAKRQMQMGLLIGFGILAKGPVAYLLPMGTLCLYSAFCGRSTFRFFPRKALLWGLVPPLVWIGALLIEVSLRNDWAYLNNLLFKQTVVRFLNPWHHYQPWHYFGQVLLYDFQPWIWLLLGAIPFRREQRANLEPRSKFAWAMVIFTVLFFSMSSGKRNLYIMPLYPFAAYLVAERIRNLLATPGRGPLWGFLLPALTTATVGAAAIALATGRLDHKLPDWLHADIPYSAFAVLGATILGASLVAAWSALRHKVRTSFATTLMVMGLLNILVYQIGLPWISPYRSARRFSEEMTQYIQTHDTNPTVAMVEYRSAYRFYGGYHLVELSDSQNNPPGKPPLATFWSESPKGWVILRRDQLSDYQAKFPARVTIHLAMNIGRGEEFLLVTRNAEP